MQDCEAPRSGRYWPTTISTRRFFLPTVRGRITRDRPTIRMPLRDNLFCGHAALGQCLARTIRARLGELRVGWIFFRQPALNGHVVCVTGYMN